MKYLTILLAFLMTIGSQAGAKDGFFFDTRLTAGRLTEINSVYVSLSDESLHACWTNLKEAREYAEEKLRIKGIKTIKTLGTLNVVHKDYHLTITVNAHRLYEDGTGPCTGHLKVELYGWVTIGGLGHAAQLGIASFRQNEDHNLNEFIMLALSKTFDMFPN